VVGYTGFIGRNSKLVLIIGSPCPVTCRREKQILIESEQREDRLIENTEWIVLIIYAFYK